MNHSSSDMNYQFLQGKSLFSIPEQSSGGFYQIFRQKKDLIVLYQVEETNVMSRNNDLGLRPILAQGMHRKKCFDICWELTTFVMGRLSFRRSLWRGGRHFFLHLGKKQSDYYVLHMYHNAKQYLSTWVEFPLRSLTQSSLRMSEHWKKKPSHWELEQDIERDLLEENYFSLSRRNIYCGSRKSLQLRTVGNKTTEATIVLELYRLEGELFALIIRPPLSRIQGFAIALAMMEYY